MKSRTDINLIIDTDGRLGIDPTMHAGDINGRLRGHAALLTGPPLKHVCGVNLDRFTYDALQSPVGRRPLSKLNSIH